MHSMQCVTHGMSHGQVDVMLLQQGGSAEEPAADENRFELVLKKVKGIAVGSFGILQIPISFKALSLEESSGEVQILLEGASVGGQTLAEPLLWQYPVKVSIQVKVLLGHCKRMLGQDGTPWLFSQATVGQDPRASS